MRGDRAYSALQSSVTFLSMTSTWRGFKDMVLPERFCQRGGTELGVLRTPTELSVALGRSKPVALSCFDLKMLMCSGLAS